jgi:hypothetical protein
VNTVGRLAKVLVPLGAMALAALLLFMAWEVYAPGEPPEIQLAGCDFVFLHETPKHDAGAMWRDYDLACIVTRTSPPPLCDDVMARYLAAKGPLPKDVNVIVRGEQPGAPDVCRRKYYGDGTPAR